MKLIRLLPFILLYFNVTQAQTPEEILQTVQQKYTTEKIYFHYDKSFYRAGETIWFKAYLMEGFLPSTKSTILAVEFLNEAGKLVDKKFLPITGSAAIGEFTLPRELPHGNYTVKAYTRNLMNFGFESFYYKQINIYNASGNVADSLPGTPSYKINFLPEAGNMVGNVESRIAFICTDNFGKPKEVAGKILDANGKEQASFQSTHNGMGSFVFLPRAGEKYTAECISGTEKQVQSLPGVIAEGVAMTIRKKENKTYFYLDASTVQDENQLPGYILGVQENLVTFKVEVPAGGRSLSGEIPVSQLPTGILQVTVFNRQHKPLAERLLFVNTGDYLPKGEFNKSAGNVNPRANNSFSFTLADSTPGSFSVSVTDANAENGVPDNIVSRFLLTSDIRGIVYHPAYYFESNDEVHQQNLDLVMLTHGWRRYSWPELFSNRFPSMAFKDPGFISVSGQASNPATGDPLLNAQLTIIAKMKDNKKEFLVAETDSSGNFSLDGMSFEDTASFSFQSPKTRTSRVTARLQSQSLSTLFRHVNTPLPKLLIEKPSEGLKIKFKEDNVFNKFSKFDGILLDEIKVKVKIKSEREKYESKHVTGSIGGGAAKTLDLISEPTTSSQNVFAYLQSRLSGVRISGGPLEWLIVYRNAMTLSGGPTPMSIYLDEIQVDPSQIATMPISQVAMVKVYAGGPLSGGAGGAMVIYTKKGDEFMLGYPGDFKESIIEGFTPTKEFYSPNYAVGNDEAVLNDERTTLYWNPYIITSAQNRAIQFSFYNSDKAKKLKIVLEGILEDGKLLHVEKIVE